MRRLAIVLLVGAALLTTGCMDVEETLTLNRNLSGQAGFVMKVDMNPLVPVIAQMQRQLAGQSGPPTAANVAAAKAQMLKSASQSSSDFNKDKQDLKQHLPPGVKLLSTSFTQHGLKTDAGALFAFDNLDSLNAIVLDRSSGQNGSQGPGNPVSKPFGDLKVVNSGGTILITSAVIDPMTKAKAQMQQMQMTQGLQRDVAAVLQGFRVVVKITAPFRILEQNATRREGNTLIWEFDAARLQAMSQAQLVQGIRVRYQK